MSTYYKVLAIDGGGIRGVIPALLLERLEALAGKRTWEMFDLIAGTSTGGILALGLTKAAADGEGSAYSARELVGFYEDHGARLFSPKWPGQLFDEKYPSAVIESLLDEYFDDAMLRDALTEVLITAYDVERRRPIVFKRRHAQSQELKRREHDFAIKKIARATSAAPTYFEPVKIEIDGPLEYMALVDGGVFANNPALCAYVEAAKLKKPEQDILMVSLGTGQLTHPLPFDEIKDWGLLTWAKQIIDVVFDGVSDNVQYLLGQLATDADQIHRFQLKLNESTSALDNATEENIRALKLAADELIFENRDSLQAIADALEG